jgi:hypothetical protein
MKNKERTILCLLITTVFLMPLMGNTASASEEAYYYFNSYTGNGWEHTPDDMVDGSLYTFAGTNNDEEIQQCNGNTCPGTESGRIDKVEIQAWASCNGSQSKIILQPIFDGGDGYEHSFHPTSYPNASWSEWFDITNDDNAPDSWDWADVVGLDCEVESEVNEEEVHCGMVQIRVTYTEGE